MRMQEIKLSTLVEDWTPDFIGTLVFVGDGSKVLLIRKDRARNGKIMWARRQIREGRITGYAVEKLENRSNCR